MLLSFSTAWIISKSSIVDAIFTISKKFWQAHQTEILRRWFEYFDISYRISLIQHPFKSQKINKHWKNHRIFFPIVPHNHFESIFKHLRSTFGGNLNIFRQKSVNTNHAPLVLISDTFDAIQSNIFNRLSLNLFAFPESYTFFFFFTREAQLNSPLSRNGFNNGQINEMEPSKKWRNSLLPKRNQHFLESHPSSNK